MLRVVILWCILVTAVSSSVIRNQTVAAHHAQSQLSIINLQKPQDISKNDSKIHSSQFLIQAPKTIIHPSINKTLHVQSNGIFTNRLNKNNKTALTQERPYFKTPASKIIENKPKKTNKSEEIFLKPKIIFSITKPTNVLQEKQSTLVKQMSRDKLSEVHTKQPNNEGKSLNNIGMERTLTSPQQRKHLELHQDRKIKPSISSKATQQKAKDNHKPGAEVSYSVKNNTTINISGFKKGVVQEKIVTPKETTHTLTNEIHIYEKKSLHKLQKYLAVEKPALTEEAQPRNRLYDVMGTLFIILFLVIFIVSTRRMIWKWIFSFSNACFWPKKRGAFFEYRYTKVSSRFK